MAAFYLDHNLAIQIADELRVLGYEASTARDDHLELASDALQLQHAADQGRILLTSDTDFVVLLEAWLYWPTHWRAPLTPTHAGILIFEQQRWRAADAALQIDGFLQQGLLLENTLYQWRASRGWRVFP